MSRRTLLLLVGLVMLVTGIVLVVAFGSGKSAAGTCRVTSSTINYHITIQNGKASSSNLSGHLCDTLTFTNKDNVAREIAFGPHGHHVPYDGVAERVLTQNESFTITLNKTGSYHWHDHLHDEITGYFTVTNK